MPFTSCLSPNNGSKVLVLGGTNFLGPAIVNSLVGTGMDITLFNRGITNRHLFPDLKRIGGDRSKGIDGYDQLANDDTSWDIVIDVWPENPNYVEEAIQSLQGRVNHYMYISSVAVYRNYVETGIDESADVRTGDQYEEGNYNLNKALSEEVVKKYFPQNHTIVRPGAIVGDRDPGPFGTNLLQRIATRNEIFAPDSNDPTQIIDARDIGNFLVQCGLGQVYGTYNLVGPKNKLGYKDLITTAKAALQSDVKIHWMTPDFVTNEMKVEPFIQVPFWIPVDSDPEPGFYQISNDLAIQKGLNFTEIEETIKVSYDSVINNRHITEKGYEDFWGITAEREEEIIQAWKKLS